ncbi:MAG: hypothetical protein ACU843_12850, partial [Gammaproteobacteria bacterium]
MMVSEQVFNNQQADIMTKHIHAEAMAEYAKDAMETDKPWERWEYFIPFDKHHGWIPCITSIIWDPCFKYRRKRKTVKIGELDVPAPIKLTAQYNKSTVELDFNSFDEAFEFRKAI